MRSAQSANRCIPFLILGLSLTLGCSKENPKPRPAENILKKPQASFILPKKENEAEEIKRILEIDKELGSKRNQRSRTVSIGVAVREYVANVKAIDLARCPRPFRKALENHLAAWTDSLKFFDTVPDLRGEMHSLFDKLRSEEATRESILEIEKAIWGTWMEVEKAQQAAIAEAEKKEKKEDEKGEGEGDPGSGSKSSAKSEGEGSKD